MISRAARRGAVAAAAPLQAAARRLADGQRLLAQGRHADAQSLLRGLVDDPLAGAEAQHLLAIAALGDGLAADAIALAQAAARARPEVARYRFALGRAHKAGGDLDAAEAAYRSALELEPDYVDAMVSLGIVHKTRGDADAAIALYDRALAIDPRCAPAHANRANALSMRAARGDEALLPEAPDPGTVDAAVRAVALEPGNPVLQRNLGVLLMAARRRREAADAFNQALSLDPTDVHACLHLGACLRSLGDLGVSCELYEKWLDHNQPHAAVMRSLAGVLTRMGEIDRARVWADRAASLDLDAFGLAQLGNTLLQARQLEQALAHGQRAVEMGHGRPDLYPTLLLGMNYLHEDPQPIFERHAEFGRRLSPTPPPRLAWQPLAEGRRLKVGYVSGDFVRHSVSYFVEALLERHDRTRFEITCYHNLGWSDAVTARLRGLGHGWVECEGLSDAALKRRIEADGIDLLVDLAGHTSHSRVMMFGLRCAPVQLAYLGYPTISGVPAIDYRITDTVIDPGDMPAVVSEQPIALPRSMFCYRPAQQPPIAPVPALRRGHVTFGSFNNIAKLSDRTLALWARVMQAVPGSRLLLKSFSMAQAANRADIQAFMAAHGVAAERLDLLPWIAAKADHLEAYNEVDVALDPYPYNGATTTCEALWMGVPVVSRRGRTHTSRMGASILSAAGCAGWICDDDDRFVDTAARLAADVDGLARWRGVARQQLSASELLDEAGFTRCFETALLDAWARSGGPVQRLA